MSMKEPCSVAVNICSLLIPRDGKVVKLDKTITYTILYTTSASNMFVQDLVRWCTAASSSYDPRTCLWTW